MKGIKFEITTPKNKFYFFIDDMKQIEIQDGVVAVSDLFKISKNQNSLLFDDYRPYQNQIHADIITELVTTVVNDVIEDINESIQKALGIDDFEHKHKVATIDLDSEDLKELAKDQQRQIEEANKRANLKIN